MRGYHGELGTLQTGRPTEDFCAVDAVFERYRMDNRLVGEFLRGALLAFAQGTLDLALGDNSARRRERDLAVERISSSPMPPSATRAVFTRTLAAVAARASASRMLLVASLVSMM